MADSTLNSLSSVANISSTALFYIVESNGSGSYLNDRKATGAQIVDLVKAGATGTGSVVLNNAPTLIAPVLGAAVATSINVATSVKVGSNGGAGGELFFHGSSTGSVRVYVSSTAGSAAIRLPAATPGTNSVVVTDSTGIWSYGALSGGGDMLAANNLSDVASTVTALSNIGATPLAGNKNLTGGFTATSYNIGSATAGTLTINPFNGYLQHYVNAGAHSLAAPASTSVTIVECTNSGGGNINFGSFTFSTGDLFSSTGTKKHIFTLIKTNSVSQVSIKYVAGT